MSFRTGIGYDVHALKEGRRLVIGGVHVPFTKGLAGHSDADVLIHALCDALLGAAALGDLGSHFPDADEKYKDANSLFLLKEVDKMIHISGCKIGNIDTIIVAQKPKMAPFIPKMRKTLSGILNISIDRISIKATTTDGLGFAGREEGIAAHASVLLETSETK
ncbi:2-C-methyl-D-erythritol 2,4-cyclodiphosphate synthase [hydrothermal vent metagenome]|uniref:2-C-methyl-D-erythritol 2,4-cyclodiphosphate synthase n=1 Tax=hydrothermal vent metagenome TaxID=652676 RepID=A0A3B0UQR8_9ZZZZ